MPQRKKERAWAFAAIIVGFLILLTGFRVLWINTFTDPEQPKIIGGALDLRGWDFSEERMLTLDGEWEFYPYTWYLADMDAKKELIQVPGDWSGVLNPDDESPYGYGSYRLRILVDPGKETAYSIQVSSVRSASALYVNGLPVGKSGEIGEGEQTSIGINVPYTSSSIRADESGVIDVVLYASNYDDPQSSGFVRSMKFGNEEKIKGTTKLSIILQVATAAVFLVHALIAGIFYVIGIRDQRLLYFALAILILTFSNLMGSDEKVLLEYLPANYETLMRSSFVFSILLSWALLQSIKPQVNRLSSYIAPWFTRFILFAIVFGIVLPLEYMGLASIVSLSTFAIAATIGVVSFIVSRKEMKGSVWFALSLVAIASHLGWWGISLATGLKTVYYPFDLMIAIVCFAGVWFKQYYQMFVETEQYALELQQVNREKDAFLMNTSHELRNPLHSILNISQAVLEREQVSLERKSVKDLETVLSVSRQMSFIVDELLDMTMLKDGNARLDLQPVSLPAVVEGVIDMLVFKTEGSSVQLQNEIPADFPLVLADENRLVQIIFNLLDNAVKFTWEGEIIIQASAKKGRAYIQLSDTGIGITEEVIHTIFDPYIQAHDGEGGLGLGLNISKQLVELHGGTLEVESIVGEGTTVRFSLATTDLSPLDEGPKETVFQNVSNYTAATTSLIEQVEFAESQNCSRILVVDDDPVNLRVVETTLSGEAYQVKTVLSGEEALKLLTKQEWDLVISDVMMPKMSGYALTKKIRERFTMTELPVLLITARKSPADLQNAFSVGANDYVTKPMDMEEVRSRVRALTEVKRSMRERLQIESAWLQAQIQPHFLFNALNTIIALSAIDLDRMHNVLDAFSYILRKKFHFNSLNQTTTIGEELKLVEAYLLIEKERFQERLNVIWEIDDVLEVLIPTLTIQPLVENAIHHGLMKQLEGGQLRIHISREDSYVTISIEDDGVGMAREKAASLLKDKRADDQGIGVLNTNLRLTRRYGEGLQIVSEVGQGTTLSFRVPMEEV